MHNKKRDSSNWDSDGLVPRVHKKLDEYKKKENDFITEPSGDGTYCVRKFTGEYWTVNMSNHECGCGEWQVTGFPCVHGVYLLCHNMLTLSQ